MAVIIIFYIVFGGAMEEEVFSLVYIHTFTSPQYGLPMMGWINLSAAQNESIFIYVKTFTYSHILRL